MAATGRIEDGVVLAARQAFIEVPEGGTDSAPRHEERGCESIRALFDHLGRIVGAGDRDIAVSVQQSVCVFVGVGKALSSFRMGRIHENCQPDAGVSQEEAQTCHQEG